MVPMLKILLHASVLVASLDLIEESCVMNIVSVTLKYPDIAGLQQESKHSDWLIR